MTLPLPTVGGTDGDIAAPELSKEDPREGATSALVAHLVFRHCALLQTALPALAALAARVARVHGDHDPRLVEVEGAFNELREVLQLHCANEKDALFTRSSASRDRDGIARELAGASREHLQASETLRRIRELTEDFAVPAWACTSYRSLLQRLRALEGEVLEIVHLEEDVLFPRLAPR